MFSADKIAAHLQRYGWKRDIAGDADFYAAVKAVKAVFDTDYMGLIICGCYGCGKSKLMEAIGLLLAPKHEVFLGNRDEEEKLSREYLSYYSIDERFHFLLDDMGAEKTDNDYGIKTNAVADFLTEWHNKMRLRVALGKSQPRLFITTNLTAQEVVDRYGGRVYSRLKDLVIPLKLNGGDKRKWQVAK